MGLLQSLIAFIGRALLSVIFVSSAIFKIIDWQETLQRYTQALNDWLPLSIGHPTLQEGIEWALVNISFLLTLSVVFQLVGGIFVFLGLWTRLGALLLILFLVPETFLFHHFWMLQEPDRQMQMADFMKNVTITGGLLFVLSMGKGGKSCVKNDTPK